MYQLAAVIEAGTGLRGYDSQVELPTAEAAEQVDVGAEMFDQVAASFSRRGITTYDHDTRTNDSPL